MCEHDGKRIPKVRESAVMGRSAVAIVVAFWQLVPIGYVIGLSGSRAIGEQSSTILPAVWSGCFVLAGVLMAVVYLVEADPDKNVVEIGALIVLAAAVSTYLLVLLDRADSLDGQLAVLAVLGALVVNCTGRAVLLCRQVWQHRQALAAIARTSG